MRAKQVIGHFVGFIEWVSFAQGNVGVKKVFAPSKNLSKWLKMCFAKK
jgi:hypothetical protein